MAERSLSGKTFTLASGKEVDILSFQQNPTVPRPTLNEIQSPISVNDKDKGGI